MVGSNVVREERGEGGEGKGGDRRVEGHFIGEAFGVVCIVMFIRYKTMLWSE